MKVQIPAEQIDREVQSRLKSVGKTARLDGFRKGKVPFSVIKKRYGGQVHREVLGDMIQTTYADALREQELNPAGQPSIEPGPIEQGKDVEYTAVFEVYPEVSNITLEGLKIERTVSGIKDSDLDSMIETLRKQRSSWDVAERKAAEGDQVTIDFIGSIDGEEFAGGKADDYPVVIGSGQLLPDLEQGLIGLKSDDQKDIKVSFPESYHAEELAGKTANFNVTAKKVEEQVLPEIDADFIKTFGVEDGDEEKFRESVKDNMRREMDERVSAKLRQQVLDKFWDANEFDLPVSLVDQEVKYMQEDSLKRMGIQDMSQLPPREPFEDQARRRVGLGLLINEVIKSEKLEVDNELVDQKLSGIAVNYEKPDEVVQQYRSNPNLMQQIEMMVLEEQVVSLLVDKANVADKEVAFDELMSH